MKKFLLLLLLPTLGFGAISADKEYKLNQYMGPVARDMAMGTLIRRGGQFDLALDGIEPLRVVRATYDFSTMGGATTAAISLGQTLPAGAIIIRSWIDTKTALTSTGSATVALKLASSNDVKTATGYASFSGIIEGAQTGAASAFLKLSAAKTLTMNIATAQLTAGKFTAFLEYVVGD